MYIHTVMLYVNLILRVRANWRQGPLAKNAPSDVRGIVTQEVDQGSNYGNQKWTGLGPRLGLGLGLGLRIGHRQCLFA